MDLDEQTRRRNRIYLIVAGSLFAGFFLVLVFLLGPQLALVWTSPILGSVFSYLLVQHWAGKPFRWLKHRAYAGMSGNFHAYDDLQVRVRWNGASCEVALIDVLGVLRIPRSAHFDMTRRLSLRFPQAVYLDQNHQWWFAERALLDWLDERSRTLDPHVLRFRRWLEKETFPAMRRKMTEVPDSRTSQ